MKFLLKLILIVGMANTSFAMENKGELEIINELYPNDINYDFIFNSIAEKFNKLIPDGPRFGFKPVKVIFEKFRTFSVY